MTRDEEVTVASVALASQSEDKSWICLNSVLCDIRRGVKKEQDELEKALHAEMGDEGPPKMDGGFSADSNFDVGVLVMQTAVNVNADAEWDGVSQTIKEGLGEVRDEDEADQKELEQENKALAA